RDFPKVGVRQASDGITEMGRVKCIERFEAILDEPGLTDEGESPALRKGHVPIRVAGTEQNVTPERAVCTGRRIDEPALIEIGPQLLAFRAIRIEDWVPCPNEVCTCGTRAGDSIVRGSNIERPSRLKRDNAAEPPITKDGVCY